MVGPSVSLVRCGVGWRQEMLLFHWARLGEYVPMESVIDGDGLRLRLWELIDEALIADILDRSREAFGDWLPGTMKDLADISSFLRQVGERFEKQSAYYYAIVANEEAVG